MLERQKERVAEAQQSLPPSATFTSATQRSSALLLCLFSQTKHFQGQLQLRDDAVRLLNKHNPRATWLLHLN